MADGIQLGPTVRTLQSDPNGPPGRTSGDVPVTMPGERVAIRDPTQGDLAAIGMEEGFRNPLPNTVPYLQEPPLLGGAPTA